MSEGRLLIWDFDGTLATRPEGWTGAMIEALRESGFLNGVTPEDLRPHLQTGFSWHTPGVREPVTPDQWWADLGQVFVHALKVGADLSESEARLVLPGIRSAFVRLGSWSLFSDTVATLTQLREAHWRHVVLSNHVPELPQLVSGLRLDDLVEDVFSSASTGMEKPCREAFDLVVSRQPARKTVMIGDNFEADIRGAQNAGLEAILVRKTHPDARFQAASLEELWDILEAI